MWGVNLFQIRPQVVGKGMCRIDLAQQPSTKQDRSILCPEFIDPRFNLRSKVSHQTLNGPCGGVSKSTDRSTLDLFAVQGEPIDGWR